MRSARAVAIAFALVVVTSGIGSAGTDTADWPTYHRDSSRSGFAEAGPDPSSTARQWRTRRLDGAIYAEPLLVDGVAIVATENNTVYAFDALTGKRKWRRHLGTPVNGGDLPCGNIDPSGITSTPVADADAGVVYVVTFTEGVEHTLVALDPATGKKRFSRAADAPGADPEVEQQRGALGLVDGRVLVPYGGLFGDCGDYHGYVVGIPADGEGNLRVYEVPAARAAGVWTPSGTSVDGAGNVLLASGNATELRDDGGEDLSNSVIRLDPQLELIDSWTPRDRDELSQSDIDLGQIAPVPIPNGTVFMVGKAGTGYLLDGDDLGGTSGQLFDDRVCESGAWGGTARVKSRVFVACGEGLAAVDVVDERFEVTWRSEEFDAGPPIVTGDTVWSLDISGGGLRAFDAESGEQVRELRVGDLANFATPTAGGGLVYVAADRRLIAYGEGE